MWCDNCCLLFPMRRGAMALCFFIFFYSLAGSIFLFYVGSDFWPDHYESYVFAFVSFVNCIVSFVSTVALSRQSWSALKSLGLLWALVIGLSLVRAIAMLVILNSNSSRIAELCGATDTTAVSTPAVVPRAISSPFKGFAALYCPLGFHTLFVAFAGSLVIDGILQAYAASLVVRTHKRMVHYKSIKSSTIDDITS